MNTETQKAVTLETLAQAAVLGFNLAVSEDGSRLIGTINIPFDDEKEGFSEEAEGARYNIPLKARGEGGELFIKSGKKASKNNPLTLADFGEFDKSGRNAEYNKLPVIKDGKKDMYVNLDGTLTTDAYSDEARRNVKSTVVKVPCQASDKRMYNINIASPDIVWPDGNARRLAIEIKANNPLPPEEMEAQKAQATQKRQATSVQRVLAEDKSILRDAVLKNLVAAKASNATIRMVLEAQKFEVPEQYLND